MTENKITDTEIMKALECCYKHRSVTDCQKCPCYKNFVECQKTLAKSAIDLINRKNADIAEKDAEIARLKKTINSSAIILPARSGGKTFLIKTTIEKITESARTAARAEAIKEFAERVKELNKYYTIIEDSEIDKIAKEMVGDTDV